MPGVLAYQRCGEGQTILVAGNYGEEPCTLSLEKGMRKVLLSNLGKETAVQAQAEKEGRITLESCESVVILL